MSSFLVDGAGGGGSPSYAIAPSASSEASAARGEQAGRRLTLCSGSARNTTSDPPGPPQPKVDGPGRGPGIADDTPTSSSKQSTTSKS